MRASDDLERSWERTARHLEAAAGPLFPIAQQALITFQEYLYCNELGLALDELEAIALEVGAGEATWRPMLDAAIEMRLGDHEARYRTRLATSRAAANGVNGHSTT